MAKKRLPIAKPSGNSCPQPIKMTKDDEARQRRYKAKEALGTINRAKDFEKDKSLMADVKALAKEQIASLKRIK